MLGVFKGNTYNKPVFNIHIEAQSLQDLDMVRSIVGDDNFPLTLQTIEKFGRLFPMVSNRPGKYFILVLMEYLGEDIENEIWKKIQNLCLGQLIYRPNDGDKDPYDLLIFPIELRVHMVKIYRSLGFSRIGQLTLEISNL